MTFINVAPINNKEANWAYTIRPYRLEFTYFQFLWFEGGNSDWLWVEGVVGRGLWVEDRGGYKGNPKYYTISAKAYVTL